MVRRNPDGKLGNPGNTALMGSGFRRLDRYLLKVEVAPDREIA
jgi:hypothetical protein